VAPDVVFPPDDEELLVVELELTDVVELVLVELDERFSKDVGLETYPLEKQGSDKEANTNKKRTDKVTVFLRNCV
jgi:hypothetical protein